MGEQHSLRASLGCVTVNGPDFVGRLPAALQDAAGHLGALHLMHILLATGVDPADVVIIRHTFNKDGLRTPSDVTPERVLEYTRQQGVERGHKLGVVPAGTWLVFISDGARRSRFYVAYDNLGEASKERTDRSRFFDLRESDLLRSLRGRLVIEWTPDTINWVKKATAAANLPVVEIADPEVVPFPGYDRVLVDYDTLRLAVTDSRYAAWQAALGSVQGIYLIADTSTGHLYVGKADGRERILGRWTQYARDGHGGILALRALAGDDVDHARHFQFSLLRVFSPSALSSEVDEAEAHFKRALLARQFGLNRN